MENKFSIGDSVLCIEGYKKDDKNNWISASQFSAFIENNNHYSNAYNNAYNVLYPFKIVDKINEELYIFSETSYYSDKILSTRMVLVEKKY